MTSKAEAKQLAGELLKIVPINQAMQSQDDTRMGEAYDQVYADLREEGLATWATSGEMNDEITPHFIALMAYNKLDSYPTSDSLYQRILRRAGFNGENAKREIRKLITPAYESLDEPTDY